MRRPLIVLLPVLLLLLGACGLQSSSGRFVTAESEDGSRPLDGAKIAVTSKSFTEGVLLGKITATILNAAGAAVTDLTNAPGSNSSRQAMLDGQADVTWEYTGTAWVSYLGKEEKVSDPDELFRKVRDAERANGLEWLPSAPFNNSYTFAVTEAQKRALSLNTLSDLFRLPPAQRPLCIDPEFQSRSDGLGPLLQTYDVPLGSGTPQGSIRTMDAGVIYQAISDGTCVAGDVYATDGRVGKLNLQLLEDDRKFFLPYYGAPIVRTDTLHRYPAIAPVLEKVARLLTNETMQKLNGEIDSDGRDPAAVAADWLRSVKLVR